MSRLWSSIGGVKHKAAPERMDSLTLPNLVAGPVSLRLGDLHGEDVLRPEHVGFENDPFVIRRD